LVKLAMLKKGKVTNPSDIMKEMGVNESPKITERV
jgi:hypothetical protein